MNTLERLRPNAMDHMKTFTQTGAAPLHPLFSNYSDDPHSWEIEDQPLLGPDLLVTTVLRNQDRTCKINLPFGRGGTDVYISQTYEVGQHMEVIAQLDPRSVFSRNDVKLPLLA